MSVTEIHDGKRLRVYVSLGTVNGKKQYRQEYISLVGLSKMAKKAAWTQAKMREKEIRDEHKALSIAEKKDTPFRFDKKNSLGREADSPFMIRGLTITVPSPCGTRQLVPNWSKKGYMYTFHTYPPRLTYQMFEHNDGERDYFHTKTFSLRQSTDYTEAYLKAIDHIIQYRPFYAEYKLEMLNKMPPWIIIRKFIEAKYHHHWGEFPWVIKKEAK